MRRRSRTASMFITAALAAGIVTATATAASATGLGSCSAQGDFATCDASGTAADPVAITVTVTASPNQAVFVSWTDTCSVGTSAGGKSGSFTAQTPVTRTITHPWHQPDTCVVAAGAQLQAGGNSVHVSLSYSRTAAPAPVSHAIHPIRGYAGKCADDSGNSSAAGAKMVIWMCNAGDKAQGWTYSGSQLKHNGNCLRGQGSGSKVVLSACNGSASETWTHKANGEYVLKASGLCLDDPVYSKKNGTQLVVYRCGDTANQRWTLP